MFPSILHKDVKKLEVLSDSKIAELLESVVTTGDTLSMLIGRVVDMLLFRNHNDNQRRGTS